MNYYKVLRRDDEGNLRSIFNTPLALTYATDGTLVVPEAGPIFAFRKGWHAFTHSYNYRDMKVEVWECTGGQEVEVKYILRSGKLSREQFLQFWEDPESMKPGPRDGMDLRGVIGSETACLDSVTLTRRLRLSDFLAECEPEQRLKLIGPILIPRHVLEWWLVEQVIPHWHQESDDGRRDAGLHILQHMATGLERRTHIIVFKFNTQSVSYTVRSPFGRGALVAHRVYRMSHKKLDTDRLIHLLRLWETGQMKEAYTEVLENPDWYK